MNSKEKKVAMNRKVISLWRMQVLELSHKVWVGCEEYKKGNPMVEGDGRNK